MSTTTTSQNLSKCKTLNGYCLHSVSWILRIQTCWHTAFLHAVYVVISVVVLNNEVCTTCSWLEVKTIFLHWSWYFHGLGSIWTWSWLKIDPLQVFVLTQPSSGFGFDLDLAYSSLCLDLNELVSSTTLHVETQNIFKTMGNRMWAGTKEVTIVYSHYLHLTVPISGIESVAGFWFFFSFANLYAFCSFNYACAGGNNCTYISFVKLKMKGTGVLHRPGGKWFLPLILWQLANRVNTSAVRSDNRSAWDTGKVAFYIKHMPSLKQHRWIQVSSQPAFSPGNIC